MLDLQLRELKERVLHPVANSFKNVSPNSITTVAFVVGVACACTALFQWYSISFLLWVVNRILDGLDGVVARTFNKATDFGGYYDIICDFFVYGLIPTALVVADPSEMRWIALSVLLISYFVNAAGLFQLAAILEKNQAVSNQELTTVTMPNGLIEGTETVIMYGLFLLFPKHITALFSIFSCGVYITIVQRIRWAAFNI